MHPRDRHRSDCCGSTRQFAASFIAKDSPTGASRNNRVIEAISAGEAADLYAERYGTTVGGTIVVGFVTNAPERSMTWCGVHLFRYEPIQRYTLEAIR